VLTPRQLVKEHVNKLVHSFQTQDLRATFPIVVEIKKEFLKDDEKKFALS
jgi:hypothetical protein